MFWEKYYEKTRDRTLRSLYSRAIQFLSPTAKRAVDLGCGVGTEVLDLLQRGLEVHAVDQESRSIELITTAAANSEMLYTHISSLENFRVWPQVDFLFAYHSFPFCAAQSFESVVDKSLSSVRLDGIYAVSFFGPDDDWVKEEKVVGITAAEVKNKLHTFEVLHFEEIKKAGPTALQSDKMWDVIEVVARRN